MECEFATIVIVNLYIDYRAKTLVGKLETRPESAKESFLLYFRTNESMR